MASLSEDLLRLAEAELHQEEVPRGSNWGGKIITYLKSVGIVFPASWCMAYVYWCTKQLEALHPGYSTPLLKTGGVLNQWNKRQNLAVKKPQAGDIFIMDFGHGLGHTGFIVEVLADGTFKTIEGNTNNDGSREGYEVEYKIRKPSQIKGYLRATA